MGLGVNEPKCHSKNKISHGNNNNKNKQELTAKSKAQRGKQKPHGKKRKKEFFPEFFLDSKFFPDIFLEFFHALIKFFSRFFSRLFSRLFSPTFFPTFFLDFFYSLSDTSKAHSWIEVPRDMAWFDSWLILFIRSRLLHNQLLIINSNQWKSITFRRIGEWLSIFIDWLSQSILIKRFLLIEINDWYLLIVLVWGRRGAPPCDHHRWPIPWINPV